jgi:hypothetical protein
MNLPLKITFVHISKVFKICGKILGHGAVGFTSPPKKGFCGFLSLLARTEHANLGSNCNHANHYSTGDDFIFS